MLATSRLIYRKILLYSQRIRFRRVFMDFVAIDVETANQNSRPLWSGKIPFRKSALR